MVKCKNCFHYKTKVINRHNLRKPENVDFAIFWKLCKVIKRQGFCWIYYCKYKRLRRDFLIEGIYAHRQMNAPRKCPIYESMI